MRPLAVALALAFVLTSSALAGQTHGTKPKRYPPPSGTPAPEIAMEAAGGLAVLLVGSFLLLQSRKRVEAR